MQQIKETFEMKLSSKSSLFSVEIFFAIYSEITPPEVFLNRSGHFYSPSYSMVFHSFSSAQVTSFSKIMNTLPYLL